MPVRVSVSLIWDEAAAMVEALAIRLAREMGANSKHVRNVRATATRMRMIGFLDSRREVSIDPTPVGAIGPDEATPRSQADSAALEATAVRDPSPPDAEGASGHWLAAVDDDTGPFG